MPSVNFLLKLLSTRAAVTASPEWHQKNVTVHFSDVYVFGVGDTVKKEELNSLASQKSSEQHVFILKDFQTLGEVFNSIISE